MTPSLKSLETLQINLHKSSVPSAELRQVLAQLHTFVSLIQEPYLYRDTVSGFQNPNWRVIQNNKRGRVRAAIVLSKNIDAVPLTRFVTNDLVAIGVDLKLRGLPQKVVFASLYLPYEGDVPIDEFVELYEYCRQSGLPLVVGCDANAHMLRYGSSDNNFRGLKLLDFLQTTDLVVLNRGNHPTFHDSTRSEVIDFTLASERIAQKIADWRVSSDVLTSDHFCIRFRMPDFKPKVVTFRKPSLTDWSSYCDKLGAEIDRRKATIYGDSLDDAAEAISHAVTRAYHGSCRLRSVKLGKQVPWWNPALTRLRRESRQAWNIVKRIRRFSGVSDSGTVFRQKRKEYKKELRRAKRLSWRLHCESVEGMKNASVFRRALNSTDCKTLGSVKLANGSFADSEEEILNRMLEVHFPDCTRNAVGEVIERVPVSVHIPTSLSEDVSSIVDEGKVQWAMKSFEPFKSPGCDGIVPALLQNGLELLTKPLTHLYKASLATGVVPQAWRSVKVIFIPKHGKEDYSDPKAWRPISLSSYQLKGLERLVDLHIRSTALIRNPISPHQYAYSKGKSTDAAVHCVVNAIERAFQCDDLILGVTIDIVGAFDNTSYTVIREALTQFEVESFIVEWLIGMLNSRRLMTSLGDCSLTVSATRGCPQGGVISPLLWLLVVNSLLKELTQPGLTVVGYADDVTIFLQSKLIEPLYKRAQTSLNIVESWCNTNMLSVNPEKTSLVLFTKKRKLEPYRKPTLFGVTLENSDTMKFLGVILDKKLTFIPNIEQRYRMACNVFWQCRHSYGASWGLKPSVVLWFYKSIVRPIATTSCHVWWNKAAKGAIRSMLDKLQRMACLAITSAMRTTPSDSMQVLLDLPPLHLFVESEAMRIMYRLNCLEQLSSTVALDGHSSVIELMIRDLPVLKANSDLMIPVLNISHEFSVLFPSRNDWVVEDNEPPLCLGSDWKLCFTDGSVMDGHAGASVYSRDFEMSLSFYLGSHCTIFQAELMAICLCSQTLLEKGVIEERLCICVDSQAALKALTSSYIKSSTVLQCVKALQNLCEFNSVKLLWVPGHQGVTGNEEADRLARVGVESNNFSPEPLVPLPLSFVHQYRRERLQRNFRFWFTHNAGPLWQTRRVIDGPDPKYTQQLTRLTRTELRVMVGVITGHVGLNYHLSKFVQGVNPMCGCCSEQSETALHLLCVCPAHANQRRLCLGDPFPSHESIKLLKVSTILNFLRRCGHFPELGRP